MDIFPQKVITLWNGWIVRVMIFLSLLLQITLLIFGSRRKYTKSIWIRIIVWSAYMAADWMATVALGNLAGSQGGSKQDSLKPDRMFQAFWSPFLLMHLGGPDTITAYSLEDNELWLRHFLGFIVQVGVALYVFLWSWSENALTFLAIPAYFFGILKYGERSLALWYASSQHFSQSWLPDPDPGPDNLEENILVQSSEITIEPHDNQGIVCDNQVLSEEGTTVEAYMLFKNLTLLYAGKLLNYRELVDSSTILLKRSAQDAFNLIAAELGFMYDVLYTKATVLHSTLGAIIRSYCLLFLLSALVAFSVKIDRNAYPLVDILLTYLLLAQAIVLEAYGFYKPRFSDWTNLWIRVQLSKKAQSARSDSVPLAHLTNHKKWSKSMGQYNLLDFCLSDRETKTCVGVQKWLCVDQLVEKYQYLTWKDVEPCLIDLIFKQLQEKRDRLTGHSSDTKLCKELLASRGDLALTRFCLDDFGWSITEVEFDRSLLIWHIATHICYNNDNSTHGDTAIVSKHLSDYMMYVRVLIPSMLPEGIDEVRYMDTCAAVKRFFNKKRDLTSSGRSEAYQSLLETNISAQQGRSGSQSVLLDGCRLAKQLQQLELQNDWNTEKKWELISEVWIEMLAYTANSCGWKEHFQHLRRGGELLTHVRVLMTHLGLSEQYYSSKQDTRRRETTFFDKLLNDNISGKYLLMESLFEVRLGRYCKKLKEFIRS